jgi:hypothetical protein
MMMFWQTNFINRDSVERYMNSPVQFTLDAEIRKAAYTLYNFTSDNAIEGADTIPRYVCISIIVFHSWLLFSKR